MMTNSQIRGMLLEEAVLYLLQRSGYRTVEEPADDPTLCLVGAGIAVRGRGCAHQIDAIADFVIHPPFTNPQRLFVEAKCLSSRVGVDVVRNAVGVLKDASEFWVSASSNEPSRCRYHYQYAIFSASEFSDVAQRYAFAQDVHLFPLGSSRFFQPILRAIDQIGSGPHNSATNIRNRRQLSSVRAFVRETLRGGSFQEDEVELAPRTDFRAFVEACRGLNYALVAVLGGRLPVLLAPSAALRVSAIDETMRVRISWNEDGWYLRSQTGQMLFSFDLPDELFELYAENGTLTRRGALNLKEEMMSEFQAVDTGNGRARIVRFVLDRDWIADIRGRRRRRGESGARL